MLRCVNCLDLCGSYYFRPYWNYAGYTVLCENCWKEGLKFQELNGNRRFEVSREIVDLSMRRSKVECHTEKTRLAVQIFRLEQEQSLIVKHYRADKEMRFISKVHSHYFETIELPAIMKAGDEKFRIEEAKRKAEQERIRVKIEAEKKRIAEELERKKKAAEERKKKATEEHKKKEEELKPYEEEILNEKTISLEYRLKLAKETYREEVMLQLVYDSATSVVESLQHNRHITKKVRNAIKEKKEIEERRRKEKEQRRECIKTTIWWIVGLVIIGVVIMYL